MTTKAKTDPMFAWTFFVISLKKRPHQAFNVAADPAYAETLAKLRTQLMNELEAKEEFVLARSHVFVIVTFWDERQGRAIQRVIDPAMNHQKPLTVASLRTLFSAPEGFIFTAPPLDRFWLDPALLTQSQRGALRDHLGEDSCFDDLDHESHAALIRRLTGAELGSIGDPLTWSYANNIHSEQLIETPDDPKIFRQHDATQSRTTMRPDKLRPLIADLIREREQFGPNLPSLLAAITSHLQAAQVAQILADDAS